MAGAQASNNSTLKNVHVVVYSLVYHAQYGCECMLCDGEGCDECCFRIAQNLRIRDAKISVLDIHVNDCVQPVELRNLHVDPKITSRAP